MARALIDFAVLVARDVHHVTPLTLDGLRVAGFDCEGAVRKYQG